MTGSIKTIRAMLELSPCTTDELKAVTPYFASVISYLRKQGREIAATPWETTTNRRGHLYRMTPTTKQDEVKQ